MADRTELARRMYEAFPAGDRDFFEKHLADEFTFSAPPDPLLDRAGYFERCWPSAGRGNRYEIVRLIEAGNEVVVTYESETSTGRRGRNTEVITFDGEGIARV